MQAMNTQSDSHAIVIQPGMVLSEVEKMAILATLKAQRNNRTRSAKVLGIGIRTLQRKLKQYQLEGQVSSLNTVASSFT